MKKIGIIGAGVSGLSVAKSLGKNFEVEILEKKDFVGGIARPVEIDGFPYHIIGGHCMNSKNLEIMEFIFSILPREEWHVVNRNATVFFRGRHVPYPLEFSVKEISEFDPELAYNIVIDFFKSKKERAKNLEEWFVNNFGQTLATEYFIPYNRKIWAREPCTISPTWVIDKLPIPNKKSFLESLISKKAEDNMPHAHFYYPNSNTMGTFLEFLAAGTKIIKNYPVEKIENVGGRWSINGEKKYDILINTSSLKDIPSIINAPKQVIEKADLLMYNTVTNMLWESEPTNRTWTYYPSPETFIYKQGYVGNFLTPKKPQYASIEAITFHSEEEMIREGKKFSNLIRPISYSTSKEPAYIVYDQNYDKSVSCIQSYLDNLKNFYTLGRFGEWVYYNMDKCIESAKKLANKINKR